jgi:hypothetical protein
VGELGRAEAVGQDVRNHERGVDARQCTRVDERVDELDEARQDRLDAFARRSHRRRNVTRVEQLRAELQVCTEWAAMIGDASPQTESTNALRWSSASSE